MLQLAPKWVPLIEAYHPEALEEARGVADASGFAFAEILALNGRGELRLGDPFGGDGCTSFAMTAEAAGDGHVYCGQNWDWRVGTKESVVMLRVEAGAEADDRDAGRGRPDRPARRQLGRDRAERERARGAVRLRAGVPSPYIRRRILDSTTMHDALAAVMNATQSVCANLVFTHRDGYCVDLETTPARHGVVEPTEGLLAHANAFLGEVPEQIEESYRPSSVDSLYRAPRVEGVLRRARAASHRRPRCAALIETALADHFSYPNSVCAHPDPRDGNRWETVASAYADLTTGDYLVAPGNPCEHDYEPLPWNLYA